MQFSFPDFWILSNASISIKFGMHVPFVMLYEKYLLVLKNFIKKIISL